jgi:hypothetical protein
MNISDTDVFDVDVAARSTSAPTGSPTCSNLRVDTPASIRSITARVSGSRSAKYSYVATGSSRSSSAVRIRGRRTATRRPPNVIDPSSWPWRFAVRSALCLPFGPTTSSNLELHQLVHDAQADADAESEQALPGRPNELTERLLDPRWERTLPRLQRGHDPRRGYLLHGGSSCPRGLGLRPARSQPERTRREDRRSKFYEISDNLGCSAFASSTTQRGTTTARSGVSLRATCSTQCASGLDSCRWT